MIALYTFCKNNIIHSSLQNCLSRWITKALCLTLYTKNALSEVLTSTRCRSIPPRSLAKGKRKTRNAVFVQAFSSIVCRFASLYSSFRTGSRLSLSKRLGDAQKTSPPTENTNQAGQDIKHRGVPIALPFEDSTNTAQPCQDAAQAAKPPLPVFASLTTSLVDEHVQKPTAAAPIIATRSDSRANDISSCNTKSGAAFQPSAVHAPAANRSNSHAPSAPGLAGNDPSLQIGASTAAAAQAHTHSTSLIHLILTP